MDYTDSHCHLYDTRGVAGRRGDRRGARRGGHHDDQRRLRRGDDRAGHRDGRDARRHLRHRGLASARGQAWRRHDRAVSSTIPTSSRSASAGSTTSTTTRLDTSSARRSPRRSNSPTSDHCRSSSTPATRGPRPSTSSMQRACRERTIFHCFTGGPDEARQCLERGAYLSFSGIVTFKTATELHDAARLCPIERMLAETDSPYLAPVPHRGRPNQSGVRHPRRAGTRRPARCRPLDDVRAATVANACLAFPGIRP